jgi:hypothetical protein
MAATKCPQQAGGRQGKKNNPTGRKGRKRRITTLSTRSMELVKATSEHPNLRKGRQNRRLYCSRKEENQKQAREYHQYLGGAAMKAIINTEVAVNKVGIINTPNHPM